MTTTTIDERLDLIEAMGEENQVLLDSIKAKETNPAFASSPPPFKTALLAAILTGLGGLLVGIAIGTTYIAPTL